MKRFLVFAGDDYYPGGGWRDLLGAYDTLEAATAAARARLDPYSWAHIIDTETPGEIIDVYLSAAQ